MQKVENAKTTLHDHAVCSTYLCEYKHFSYLYVSVKLINSYERKHLRRNQKTKYTNNGTFATYTFTSTARPQFTTA